MVVWFLLHGVSYDYSSETNFVTRPTGQVGKTTHEKNRFKPAADQ